VLVGSGGHCIWSWQSLEHILKNVSIQSISGAATTPPSTIRLVPVTNAAWSLARYSMESPTSSDTPTRPTMVRFVYASNNLSETSCVIMNYLMTLTRIRLGPNSAAIHLVNISTAHFATL
ncbi:unnamed protein product, partial [Oppiella nova]